LLACWPWWPEVMVELRCADEECCAEAADEDEGAEEEEDYTKQLGSLRASLHVKRREIKAMERQQQMQVGITSHAMQCCERRSGLERSMARM
jgi:hypothetical protein